MEHKSREPVDLLDDEEEVNYEHNSGNNTEDQKFDLIVSTLEELVMDNKFQNMQSDFCERHCDIFEESKENKLEYTDLFRQYSERIEEVMENALKARIPGITMKEVERILAEHQEELGGEIFDMLDSLGDFLEFKDLMVSAKRLKALNASKSFDLSIAGHHV